MGAGDILKNLASRYEKKNSEYIKGCKEQVYRGFTQSAKFIDMVEKPTNADVYVTAWFLMAKHLANVVGFLNLRERTMNDFDSVEESAKDLSVYFAIIAAKAQEESAWFLSRER